MQCDMTTITSPPSTRTPDGTLHVSTSSRAVPTLLSSLVIIISRLCSSLPRRVSQPSKAPTATCTLHNLLAVACSYLGCRPRLQLRSHTHTHTLAHSHCLPIHFPHSSLTQQLACHTGRYHSSSQTLLPQTPNKPPLPPLPKEAPWYPPPPPPP